MIGKVQCVSSGYDPSVNDPTLEPGYVRPDRAPNTLKKSGVKTTRVKIRFHIDAVSLAARNSGCPIVDLPLLPKAPVRRAARRARRGK